MARVTKKQKEAAAASAASAAEAVEAEAKTVAAETAAAAADAAAADVAAKAADMAANMASDDEDSAADGTIEGTVDPDPDMQRIRLDDAPCNPVPLYINGQGNFLLNVGEEYTLPIDAISALENAQGVVFTRVEGN